MGLFKKNVEAAADLIPSEVEPVSTNQEKVSATENEAPDLPIQPGEAGANILGAVHEDDAQTKLIPTAIEELTRIRNEMPAIFERAAKKVLSGEIELIGWGLSLPRVQRLSEAHAGKPWFFIGDIHGDFLAWHCLLGRARRENDFRICFLGDLIDRGPLHIESFAALLDAAEKHPGQILWILGNHDAGVRWDKQKKKFSAGGVEPAEFIDWINGDVSEYSMEQVQAWGKLFEDVSARLPRAVLFPDGTLATHGGVPLKDRLEFLKTMEALHHKRCLEDFIWTRIRPYPRKLGWQLDPQKRRLSSDFEIGYKDLEDFCRAVEPLLPVDALGLHCLLSPPGCGS